MKFKVIMDYPNGPDLGSIIVIDSDHVQYYESYNIYFAKYIGTTIDEVDLYEGDKCYWLDDFDRIRGGHVKSFPSYPCYFYKRTADAVLLARNNSVKTFLIINFIDFNKFFSNTTIISQTKYVLIDGDYRSYHNLTVTKFDYNNELVDSFRQFFYTDMDCIRTKFELYDLYSSSTMLDSIKLANYIVNVNIIL